MQRRKQSLDVVAALKYLRELSLKDHNMYYEHTTDREGRLQHLFWSDGISQLNYHLYGDVLAFDATYGKNKYLLPLVVFSGVNNHNRSTIFAGAVVSNETEETYVWLLQQFSKAMNGKEPTSIITDGDNAMRNAIKKVFPNAHHRLCAWHLLRNATSNISIPEFTSKLKKCMLGDYDVGEFREKWDEMVSEYQLEDNPWVAALYERRSMWAAAYIRGNFFVGFRTTSRCEGLHSELGKFVHSRYNLTDFLHHFHQCVEHMRWKEMEDDFTSIHGEPVMQTKFETIERSAAKHLTRELFYIFRKVLKRAVDIDVTGCSETLRHSIYNVCHHRDERKKWYVSFDPTSYQFKCSCLRMESRGLACEHIVSVLVHLKIEELPKCLVLKRWSEGAKDGLHNYSNNENTCLDSHKCTRCAVLMELYRVLADLNSDSIEDFIEAKEKAMKDIEDKKAKKSCMPREGTTSSQVGVEMLRDPLRARTKGRSGGGSTSFGVRVKRTVKCSRCKLPGHNIKTCPQRAGGGHSSQPDCADDEQLNDDDLYFATQDLESDILDTL